MYLPKNEGGNFELTPAGTFVARCYRFIDLGSHEQEYQGQSKGLKRLVMIGFELPTELMSDGRPFTIHKRYTWSMHEKSAMRKDLESWRGARFTDSDLGPGGFNVRNLLGVPCTLTIVHSENGDNTYANIASIGKAIKGMEVPPPFNPPLYLSLEREFFDQEAFEGLSDKLKDFIKLTPEWESLQRKKTSYADQKMSHETDPARDPRYEGGGAFDERNPPPTDFTDFEDDFPFDHPRDKSGRPLHPLEA